MRSHEVRHHVNFPLKLPSNSPFHRNFEEILYSYSFFTPNGTIRIFPIGILSYKIHTLFLFFPELGLKVYGSGCKESVAPLARPRATGAHFPVKSDGTDKGTKRDRLT
jgi:hypothetical protein